MKNRIDELDGYFDQCSLKNIRIMTVKKNTNKTDIKSIVDEETLSIYIKDLIDYEKLIEE